MRKDHVEQLKQFIHLSETLHFARTAAAFFLSPPTLSRNIQLLEAELGVSLFRRNKRSVSLTEEGASYLKFARTVVDHYSTLTHHLSLSDGQVSGKVRVTSSASAVYGVLVPRLRDLHDRYPKILLSLRVGIVGQLFQALLEGKTDIVISSSREVPVGLTEKPLFSQKFILVVPSTCKATAWDFTEETILIPSGGEIRNMILYWFSQKNITPNLSEETLSLEGVLASVAMGQGVGLIPEIVYEVSGIKPWVKVVHAHDVPDPFTVSAFVKTQHLQRPEVAAIWEMLTPSSAHKG